MLIEFDHDKDEANQRKHAVSLAMAAEMDFELALVIPDDRRDYGEMRYWAIGPIQDRLHVPTFTMRGHRLRAISLRKANPREGRRYEQRR